MEPKRKSTVRKSTARSVAKSKPASVSSHPHAKRPALTPEELAAVAASAPATPTTPVVMPTAETPAAGQHRAHHEPMNRHGWLVIGGTIVGLLAAFLLVFGILIYKYRSDSRIVQIVAGIVPYPAEMVNGHSVSYADYLFEVNSIKHYYLSQTAANGKPAVDFSSASGKQQLVSLQKQELQALQQEAIVRQLATKYNLAVSNQEVQAQVNQITKSAGGQAKVQSVLTKYYGWSVNDLKKKIRFQLLQQKVTNKVQSDPGLNAQAKDKAESILKQVKAGGDFATLAKQYSQDSSAANGGDLGFFSKSQVPANFANAVFALQPGQVSGILQTQYGYSIVKVIEYNADHSQVHASEILIKSIDFNQYVQDQLKSAKVHQYIHPAV